MMIFRDYDWMMVSNEAQRSQYKSKSKERASQVISDYKLKIKEKHSMLGLSFCNKERPPLGGNCWKYVFHLTRSIGHTLI